MYLQENDSVLGGQYDNKRALHNAMERKRRDSIKDSFRGLQVKNHFFLLTMLICDLIWFVYIDVDLWLVGTIECWSLDCFQDCIPTLRGDKTSRAQVLKKTGEYITHMQRKITDHQDEIKSLKSENTQVNTHLWLVNTD